MKNWIIKKLRLLLNFIFTPVTLAISKQGLEQNLTLSNIEDKVYELQKAFYGTKEKIDPETNKIISLRQYGVLEIINEIKRKSIFPLLITSKGKIFPLLTRSLEFECNYRFDSQQIIYNILIDRVAVDSFILNLKEGFMKEDHPDIDVFTWARSLLMQPKVISTPGMKDRSVCDAIAARMTSFFAEMLSTTDTIFHHELQTICHASFLGYMRELRDREIENQKEEAEKLKEKEAADKVALAADNTVDESIAINESS
jgi:hypothetical protein